MNQERFAKGALVESGSACEDLEQSLSACFERVAQSQPTKIAIGSGSWQPRYGQLNATANRVAREIVTLSRAREDRVAVLMKHDGPIIAAILGVLKAGRIAIALHPSGSPLRLESICADADPAIILTDIANLDLARVLAGAGREVVCFDDSFLSAKEGNLPIESSPSAAAFLIYTSGSTGRPKGVVQTHRNILHTVRGYTRGFHLNAEDRICLLGSLAGGQGLMTTFCTLLNGATLFPFSPAERGVAALPAWMEECKISIFISAASLFRQLLKMVPEHARFPHLRLVRLGAEPVLWSDLNGFRVFFSPECQFASVLSSTETGNVTQYLTWGEASRPGENLPVGKPVAGKEVLILQADGSEALRGAAGEIAVRSRYLSPGYWRDPEATAAAFLCNPGSEERLFRTGDLGCWRHDGELLHLGRLEAGGKVLGNRINFTEVEEALLMLPQVLNAVVAITSEIERAGQLVAWVVLDETRDEGAYQWRKALARSLPEYMIPGRIILCDAVPLAPNGKPDRHHLLSQLVSAQTESTAPPRTDNERAIATFWVEALGLSTIGVYDSFFEVGGNSLLAADLMLNLSRYYGRDIPVQALINHPTISQFAEAMESGFIHTESKLPLCWWKASLVSLREKESESPLLIVPGGYVTENELLVFAGLIPQVSRSRSVSGVRMNLHRQRVIPPFSLRGMAGMIGRSYLSRSGRKIPVIVGECQSCPLACALARWLERKLGVAPLLILLDPWHPRVKPTREAGHPTAIKRYFDLLRESKISPYSGAVHLICTAESGRLSMCLEWWSSRLGNHCEGHEVPGNHHSYLRQKSATLAATLNSILD